jgi:hypothetical protein
MLVHRPFDRRQPFPQLANLFFGDPCTPTSNNLNRRVPFPMQNFPERIERLLPTLSDFAWRLER